MKKYFIILVILLCISSAKAGLSYILIYPPDPIASWMLLTDDQGSIDSLFLDLLIVHGDSDLSINSGWLGTLGVSDTSIVNVHKASVLEAVTVDSGTIVFHALDFKFEGDYVFREFENATLRTELHQGNFIFHRVPEPSTIALIGIGGIFIFRKRRNA